MSGTPITTATAIVGTGDGTGVVDKRRRLDRDRTWVGFLVVLGFEVYSLVLIAVIVHFPKTMTAEVVGILGTILGAFITNAQNVIQYHFGTSRGSTDKEDATSSKLAEGVTPISVVVPPQKEQK